MPPRKGRPMETILQHELGQKLYYLCIVSRMMATRIPLSNATYLEVFARTVTPRYRSGYIQDGGSRVNTLECTPEEMSAAREVARNSQVRTILSSRFGVRFTAF